MFGPLPAEVVTIGVGVIVDARTVPTGDVVPADVCIVGAGPAGLTVARRLATVGMRVVVLERGTTHADASWLEGTATSIGLEYDLPGSRGSGIGGSATTWHVRTPDGGGHVRLRELDDADFAERAWVPGSGWPIGRRDLQPFYPLARALFDLPDIHPAVHEPSRRGPAVDVLTDEFDVRMFEFASRRSFTTGQHAELRQMDALVLFTNAVVTEVRIDGGPRTVSGLRVATCSGTRFTVRASSYVLAAGGIENARLLLASRSRFDKGIGNGRDMVGRYFMEHPHYASGLVWPAKGLMNEDVTAYAVHRMGQGLVQRKYALPDETLRRHELARYVFHFVPLPAGSPSIHLAPRSPASRSIAAATEMRKAIRGGEGRPYDLRLWRDIVAGAPYVLRYAAMRGTSAVRARARRRPALPAAFRIRVMAEQVPNATSRVMLDARKDEFGVEAALLQWRLTDQDLRGMRTAQRLFEHALRKSGIGRPVSWLDDSLSPPATLGGGNHHMGTTRMGVSDRQGVVDTDSRVHGLDNLYVAGSSVFPSSGYANPTLTIIALSLRLADHLERCGDRLGTP